jgi:hypothetical protein
LLGLLALAVAVGCDGQDPDRLNRVGKKLVERGRHVADDAHLPKVSVTYPGADTAAEPGKSKPDKALIPGGN